MPKYNVRSDDGRAAPIEALSPRSAASDYVAAYEPAAGTYWVRVWVTSPDGDVTRHRIEVEPDVPACSGPEHVWTGGRVRGHGAGVVTTDRCELCGCERTRDTWAQEPATGEQGLSATWYAGGAVVSER